MSQSATQPQDISCADTAKEDVFPWDLGVFDAHCHPTDTVESLKAIPDMKAKVLTIMATRLQDQHLVTDFADRIAMTSDAVSQIKSKDFSDGISYVLPAFGWHPWFSHQVFDDTCSDGQESTPIDKERHYRSVLTPEPDKNFIRGLPDPRPLSHDLRETCRCLDRFPLALVGEIGLDRSFRLPIEWGHDAEERDQSLTPGGREGRRLSPYHVSLDHQQKVLKAQLHLAGRMGRAVSVHGVAAHGVVYETIRETWKGYEKTNVSKRAAKRLRDAPAVDADKDDAGQVAETPRSSLQSLPYPPRVCLHSFSGPINILQQYLHPSTPTLVFFSFSCVINFSPPTSKIREVIKAVPDDRILIESDLHCAGEKMDDLLEKIVREICTIKKWTLEQGVRQLGTNWVHFALG